jgi:hypothetical protein
LEKLASRSYLCVSDLIQIIMDIPGVVAVKDIYFEEGNKKNRWLQAITKDLYPILVRNGVWDSIIQMLMLPTAVDSKIGLHYC